MIFPQKHITLAESIFGLSHMLLKIIRENNNKISLDDLWYKFEKINDDGKFRVYHSFDNFLLAIDLLYAINIIKNNKEVVEI